MAPTRQELILMFMLALSANPNVPTDSVVDLAEHLANDYLGLA